MGTHYTNEYEHVIINCTKSRKGETVGFQKRTQFIMEIREDQGGREMRRGWLG